MSQTDKNIKSFSDGGVVSQSLVTDSAGDSRTCDEIITTNIDPLCGLAEATNLSFEYFSLLQGHKQLFVCFFWWGDDDDVTCVWEPLQYINL